MIAWIDTVDPDAAQGELKELYDRVRTPHGHRLAAAGAGKRCGRAHTTAVGSASRGA